MPRTIHVPQGYSAQLHRATLTYDINALYTDAFTTCNILVLVGSSKVKMLHVDIDLANGPYVGEEIASMQDLEKIIIIYRESDGEIIKGFCQMSTPTALWPKIQEHKMDRQLNGVLATCNKQGASGIAVNLTYLSVSQRPSNLLCHPDEQKFLAVQKIRQVIGIREANKTMSKKQRQFRIFDGRAWEPLSQVELTVKTGHEITDGEMDFFKKEDTLVTLAGKLMGILDAMEKEGLKFSDTHKDLAESVAYFLEGYLHNFNYDFLLKRNLKNMFEHYKGEMDEDKAFRAEVIALTEQPHDITDGLGQAIERYQQKRHSSSFKNDVLSEIKMLLKHAKNRKEYIVMAAERLGMIEKAKNIGKTAVQKFRGSEYASASELYFGAIKLLTMAVKKSNPTLATGYYNLGRAMQKLGQHVDGLFSLKAALVLQREFIKASEADIENTERRIAECEIMIPQSATTQVARPQS